jgi:GT2 family glycosyltransferase
MGSDTIEYLGRTLDRSGGVVYSKMPPSPSISVVLTTYNRSDALSVVLKALSLQDDRDFEVIVADDGSTQVHQSRIHAALVESGLTATHVWHPDVGFTASRVRNLGVAVARGDYLIFLDGDCVPETDFVRRHRQLMEKGCFVNGSRVLLAGKLTHRVLTGQEIPWDRNAIYWLRQRWMGHASKLSGLLRLPDGAFRKQSKFVWRGIRSCNMAVWRSDYEAVNGFDESFVGWGHEDADFVLRLHNAKLVRKNGFCATEVFHLWHAESSRALESANATRVRERQTSMQVVATTGYFQSRGGLDMVVTKLG